MIAALGPVVAVLGLGTVLVWCVLVASAGRKEPKR